MLKLLTMAATGLMAVSFAGYDFAWLSDPHRVLRDKTLSLVEAHTGHRLAILGETRLALFPHLGVHLENVVFSATAKPDMPALMRAKRLTVAISPLAWLQNEPAIDVILSQPRFALHVNAAGQRNWQMRDRKQRAARQTLTAPWFDPVQSQKNTAQAAAQSPDDTSSAPELILRRVEMVGGGLSYANAVTDLRFAVSGIDMQGAQNPGKSIFEGRGEFRARGQKVDFEFAAPSPLAWLSGRPVKGPVAGDFKSRLLDFSLAGVAVLPEGRFSGRLTADSYAPAAALKWLFPKAPKIPRQRGRLTVESTISVNAETAEFGNISLTSPRITGTGRVKLRLAQYRYRNIEQLAFAMRTVTGSGADPVDASMPALRAAHIRIAQAGANQPLLLNGRVNWRHAVISLSGRLPGVSEFDDSAGIPLQLTASTPHGKARVNGELQLTETAGGPAFFGQLKADTLAPAQLGAAMSGVAGLPLGNLQQVSMRGNLHVRPGLLMLQQADIALTGARLSGTLKLLQSDDGFRLRGRFNTPRAELERLLGPAVRKRLQSRQVRPQARQEPGGENPFLAAFGDDMAFPAGPVTTNKAVTQKRPESRAVMRPASTAVPLTLARFKKWNVQLEINAETVTWGRTALGAGRLAFLLSGQQAELRLKARDVFSGSAAARFVLFGGDLEPALDATLSIEELQLAQLDDETAPAAGPRKDRLSGQARLLFGLSGRGKTMTEITNSLQGLGRLTVTDGHFSDATLGARAAALVLRASRGGRKSRGGDGAFLIAFDRLDIPFTYQAGHLHIPRDRPARLAGSTATGTGHGLISLHNLQLDLLARLKLATSSSGELIVPLRIRGRIGQARPMPVLSAIRLAPARHKNATGHSHE